MVKMAEFIKKVAKSGRGYIIWIPKDVVKYQGIDGGTYLRVIIEPLHQKQDKDT